MSAKFVLGSFSSLGPCGTLFVGHGLGYGESPCFRRRPFMSPIGLGYGCLFFEYLNIVNMRECA